MSNSSLPTNQCAVNSVMPGLNGSSEACRLHCRFQNLPGLLISSASTILSLLDAPNRLNTTYMSIRLDWVAAERMVGLYPSMLIFQYILCRLSPSPLALPFSASSQMPAGALRTPRDASLGRASPERIVHEFDETGGERRVAWRGGVRANAEDYEETESI